MVRLGDGRPEPPLQLSLQRHEFLALALQRSALGEMEVNLDDRDVAQEPSSVRSTWAFSYTSMMSPSLTSMKFSSVMPHSNPAWTSRTSSLKRRRVEMRPS